ncbi:hypothetical protein RUM43_005269 [Polyplax serrata]|uniref:Uncharacterized protein n=1 Tax=Polyplax serrata TaxID=468196 RepID=A0AAN8NQV7_POLSC
MGAVSDYKKQNLFVGIEDSYKCNFKRAASSRIVWEIRRVIQCGGNSGVNKFKIVRICLRKRFPHRMGQKSCRNYLRLKLVLQSNCEHLELKNRSIREALEKPPDFVGVDGTLRLRALHKKGYRPKLLFHRLYSELLSILTGPLKVPELQIIIPIKMMI